MASSQTPAPIPIPGSPNPTITTPQPEDLSAYNLQELKTYFDPETDDIWKIIDPVTKKTCLKIGKLIIHLADDVDEDDVCVQCKSNQCGHRKNPPDLGSLDLSPEKIPGILSPSCSPDTAVDGNFDFSKADKDQSKGSHVQLGNSKEKPVEIGRRTEKPKTIANSTEKAITSIGMKDGAEKLNHPNEKPGNSPYSDVNSPEFPGSPGLPGMSKPVSNPPIYDDISSPEEPEESVNKYPGYPPIPPPIIPTFINDFILPHNDDMEHDSDDSDKTIMTTTTKEELKKLDQNRKQAALSQAQANSNSTSLPKKTCGAPKTNFQQNANSCEKGSQQKFTSAPTRPHFQQNSSSGKQGSQHNSALTRPPYQQNFAPPRPGFQRGSRQGFQHAPTRPGFQRNSGSSATSRTLKTPSPFAFKNKVDRSPGAGISNSSTFCSSFSLNSTERILTVELIN